jgi:hypothetical protein
LLEGAIVILSLKRALGAVAVGAFLAAAPVALPVSEAAAQVARPYDTAQLNEDVRIAADSGRENYVKANMAAARARFGGPGTLSFVGSGGDRYDGEGYNGDIRNGLGVNSWNDGEHHGGPYRGQGDRDIRVGTGVYVFADGRRYEGTFDQNAFSGYGVMWNPDGTVQASGIWRDNQLDTPLSR